MTKSDHHLITVPGSQWAFWRWVCLRSAGFPARDVLKLQASPRLLKAADDVLGAEQSVDMARNLAIEQVNAELDDLRRNNKWDDKPRRTALLKARERLKNRGIPRTSPEVSKLTAVEDLCLWLQKQDQARSLFHQEFLSFTAEMSQVIREMAGSPRLREAITWQNRSALRTGLDWLVRNSSGDGQRVSRQRQQEELVASYLQRYCMKNDTIGFFGPVGWAQVVPENKHLVTRQGKQFLAVRKTYWESWAIEALGAVLAQKYNLEPWVAPLLVPFVRIEDMRLHHPVDGCLRISAKQAALLRACNGRDTAKQIAVRLERSPELHVQGEGDIYAELGELAERGLVFWKFNIPIGPHSEQVLREALHRIEDRKLREESLDLLDELDAARARVEASAGDPDKLNLALEFLEQLFTRITGLPATRSHGQVYAGRTLIYEDCRRDVEVLLGTDLLKPLAEPLSLLLAAGRWFKARVADTYRQKSLEIYLELVKSTGCSTVDASACWVRAMPYFFEGASAFLAPLEEEFRIKWERVLHLSPGPAQVTYSCDELRDRILKEFPPERAGWSSARYQSPDIMIAAASEEAIRQGDYFFVLGEVHVGVNTLQASLFGNQHPSPNDLINAVEQDLGPLNVVPVGPRRQDVTSRTARWLIPNSNLRLEYLPDLFATDRSRALPISSIVLESNNGELSARTRDGKLRWNVVDLIGGLLGALAVDCFRIIAPRPHTPRVSIDRLVIKRESWRFSLSELQFASCPDSAERFLQVRSWVHAQRIPRFVFFKVPVEKKPMFLDFESPIQVDIFAKMIRRTQDAALPDAIVDISEMLPTIDQTWLTDAQNQHYTSEFRFVALDPDET
jgi:hypothetical protein